MGVGYINVEKNRDAVILSKSQYFVAGNYAVRKEKLSIVESFVDYLVFLWFVLGGFEWIQKTLGVYGDSSLTSSLIFVFSFFILNFIVSLPFEIYRKFKLDQEFGFNKMTPKMFLEDILKNSLLFLIFGGSIFTLLILIIENSENWWLFGFILLFGVIVLVKSYISNTNSTNL